MPLGVLVTMIERFAIVPQSAILTAASFRFDRPKIKGKGFRYCQANPVADVGEVAELVYAIASKAIECELLWVRIPPSLPFIIGFWREAPL